MNSFYKQSLLGYRVWRLQDNKLCSLTKKTTWQQGINKSKCLKPEVEHSSPAEGCHCGFNAFYFLPDALIKETSDFDYIVWGAVAGAGRVFLKTHGWHAEEAQILSLYTTSDFITESEKKTLQKTYGVPLFNDLKKWEEFSSSLAKEVASKEIVEVIKKETSNLIHITKNDYILGKNLPLQYIGKTGDGKKAFKDWFSKTNHA